MNGNEWIGDGSGYQVKYWSQERLSRPRGPATLRSGPIARSNLLTFYHQFNKRKKFTEIAELETTDEDLRELKYWKRFRCSRLLD